jgi:hypothetical protein
LLSTSLLTLLFIEKKSLTQHFPRFLSYLKLNKTIDSIITNYDDTYEFYGYLIKENIASIFFKLENSLDFVEFKLMKIKEDVDERCLRTECADVTVPQFQFITQKLYDLELRLIENSNDLKTFKEQYDRDLFDRGFQENIVDPDLCDSKHLSSKNTSANENEKHYLTCHDFMLNCLFCNKRKTMNKPK